MKHKTFEEIEITMLHDRVLVLPEMEIQETASGLVLSEESKNSKDASIFRVGEVVAVGPGNAFDYPGQLFEKVGTVSVNESIACRQQMDVKVGDRVVYGKRAGEPLFMNGTAFRQIGNRDISAIIGPNVKIHRLQFTVGAG